MAYYIRRFVNALMFWNTKEEEDSDSSSDSDSVSDSDDYSIKKDYFNRDWLETDSTAPPPYSESSFYMGMNRSPGPRYPSHRRISPVKYPSSLSRELAKEAITLGFPPMHSESSDEDDSFFQHGRRYGNDESYYRQNSSNKYSRNKKLFGSPKETSSKQKASPSRIRKKIKASPSSPQEDKNYTPDNVIEMIQDNLIKYGDRREIISDDVFADVERHIYHSSYVDPKNREYKRGRDYYCIERKQQTWDVRPCNYDEPKPAHRNEVHPCVYATTNFY